MALAYALEHIEANNLARLTNYGEFLASHPPTHEVRIFENSSWSCAHGVERWKSDCGCNSGGHPGWNQHWRAPLRAGLGLAARRAGAVLASSAGAKLFRDPGGPGTNTSKWSSTARPESIDAFFGAQATRRSNHEAQVEALKLHGTPAPRHAHVHQLRLVLRRAFGHRNRAE